MRPSAREAHLGAAGDHAGSREPRRRAIVVAGMHRSGTSAVARLLGALGLDLPAESVRPHPVNNALGYWEPLSIVKAHDELLEELGSSWHDASPIPAAWFGSTAAVELRSRMLELLDEQYGNSSGFVLKDPRICRLLPFWVRTLREYGAEPAFVIPVRNPLEVASSLERRDALPTSHSSLLWLTHTIEAERHTRPFLRSFLSYEQLLVDPRAVISRTATDLRLDGQRVEDLDGETLGLVASDQRHHVFRPSDVAEHPDIVPGVSEAYEVLLGAAEGRAEIDTAKLDAIQAGLDGAALGQNGNSGEGSRTWSNTTRGGVSEPSSKGGAYLTRFDADRAAMAKSSQITDGFRANPQTYLERVTWFVPAFDHVLRGGLRTIFSVAEDLSRELGTRNLFVLCADEPVDIEPVARQVAEHFPDLDADYLSHRYGDDPSELPAAGTGICTLWTTAYVLLRYNRCTAKFYFVQDWEPSFYPAGSTSALIEQTYRFGFVVIANSPGVARRCRAFDDWVGTFTPGLDRSVFFPDPGLAEGPPYRLVFYGRPRNERNGFSLGLRALKRVKLELGDEVDIVSVGGHYDEAEHGVEGQVRNLGVLSTLEEVASLYRSCHLGLVFMYTAHPSYQPLEYMASGCVTVTNFNPHNDWLLRDRDNCLIAPGTASGLADSILAAFGDRALREHIRTGGLETVRNLTWERALESIRGFLVAPHPTDRDDPAPPEGPSVRNRQSVPSPGAEDALVREAAATDRDEELSRLRARLLAQSDEVDRLRNDLSQAKATGEQVRRLDATMDHLEARSGEVERLKSERAALHRVRRQELRTIGKDLRHIAGSRSWRYGHRAVRALRALARRSGGAADPVLDLLQRVAELELLEDGKPAVDAAAADQSPQSPTGGKGVVGRARALKLRVAGGKVRTAARQARTLLPFQEDAIERAALRTEQELSVAFTRRRDESLATVLDASAPEQPAEAMPVDRRGVLSAADQGPADEPSVDVVVCIHDALDDLRRCLFSLLEKTRRPFHLILVDDGSGPETRHFLRLFTDANPSVRLVTREGPPHGYTLAANDGVRASSADYVVLLNSDTIVTFGWLDRIVACGESDPSVGLVGPLSNAATHQSVPKLREAGAWAVNELPGFLTADGMAALLGEAGPSAYPRLPFINGFCYAIKRSVIDAIGLFDEVNFASGYCEENDFSYRASQARYELAVADDAYVFHAKSRSYGREGRQEIAKRNYQIFLSKHGEENIKPLVEQLDRVPELDRLREQVTVATADADSFVQAFRTACPHPLRVAFVLHGVGRTAAGGVHSIYQETQGMQTLGIDARVLVPAEGLDNARSLYADADSVFTGFADEDELLERAADRDIVVATHFRSVDTVRHLFELRSDFLPAYYVQDYEPFFFDERAAEGREALESYDAIPEALLFAKTRWLCDLVGRLHDRPVGKVEPSIDHSVYRVRERGRRGRGPVRVLGMVRPRTWRRQPLGTLRVLDRLQTELGSQVEVQIFGCEPRELRHLSPGRAGRVKNLGLLTREGVADALAAADVLLDFSTYQAFGRTALEAMACGCAAVVPRVGGTDEYAVHGENAFVIDTSSETAAFEAVAELVRDRDALRAMQGQAVETAGRFSVLRAALSEYLLLADEHARRRRSPSIVPSEPAV